MFTGEGENTRLSRITNSRWSMSAFGTASSAAMTSDDTVYSLTPLYHPSGLMMSIGGAIAGGARLALTANFEASTFWDESRRYGATIVSYTWTMLHELAVAPDNPGERHHSIRLFIGSGMPVGMWQRVQTRFRPARVLEFYAATEAGAILVNLTGKKAGSMGRPLPGSSEVRIAAYDVTSDKYFLGDDGFVKECAVDEIGMLLVRARSAQEPAAAPPLRGLFARGDAWIPTRDLFRRDEDGDYWRVDNLTDVIFSAAGPVFRGPIRDALGSLPGVDLAVAYGVLPSGAEHEVAVAAVTLVAGAELHQRDLVAALSSLPLEQRPSFVHVVPEIPVTTWFRPVTASLRKAGVPKPGRKTKAWYLDVNSGAYKPLTEAAQRRLSAAGAGA
jgi:putative long chain acyl-CoA synthase